MQFVNSFSVFLIRIRVGLALPKCDNLWFG
jgi:hypothetical protein